MRHSRSIYAITLFLFAGLLLTATQVRAETLSADEVKKAFVGNTMKHKRGFVFWGANNQLKGESNKGSTDTGKYWIKEDGQYCRKWEKWAKGREECVRIKRKGDEFSTVRLNGEVRSTFTILKGNTKGL